MNRRRVHTLIRAGLFTLLSAFLFLRGVSEPARANPAVLVAPPVAIASLEALSAAVVAAAGAGIISQTQKAGFQEKIRSLAARVRTLSNAALATMVVGLDAQTRVLQSMLTTQSCPIPVGAPGRTLPYPGTGSGPQDPKRKRDSKCLLQSACDQAQKLVSSTPLRGQWVELGLSVDEFKSLCTIVQSLTSRRKLPDNMLTKGQLHQMGWDPKRGNIGKLGRYQVGGDFYRNDAGKLPAGSWREADVTAGSSFRGVKRIFYSKSGELFLSNDHGRNHFQELQYCKDGPLH